MDVKAEVRRFIADEIIGDAAADSKDFGDDESLIEAGILDSLGMLKLISFLDEEMSSNIMAEEFRLEDFATVNKICSWVKVHGEPVAPGATVAATAPGPEAATTTAMPSLRQLRAEAMETGLQGKVALVTGASRGLGETVAKLLSLHGCRVAVNYYKSQVHAERVVREIEDAGGEAFAVRANVADDEQTRQMVAATVGRWGRIDVLVNNAIDDAMPVDFAKLSWSDIEKTFDVTIRGAFNCCKAVIPLMLRSGGGKIVNIGTLATDSPAPNQLKYVIAKSALVGLTRSLAVDYAAGNVQVNIVSPGFVETDLIGHIPEAYRARIAQDTPMKRNATPMDVAQAVVFLASRHAGFTTGQKLMVTGGAPPFL